jgi:hypothetical protein
MIVVLDTTVLHRDVHASRRVMESVRGRAAAGEWQIVVPEVVVAEAVRQYPERLRKAVVQTQKALGQLRGDRESLGLPMPDLPEVDAEAAIAQYEPALRARLTAAGCSIADHPPGAEVVGTWASTRRKPFKNKGTGAVDAFVWLTVIDCARRDDVVLITANSDDFCDPDDPERPAPELRADLDAAGISATRVRILRDIQRFVASFVTPSERAMQRAQEFLADTALRARLAFEISLAAASFPGAAGDPEDWDFEVYLDPGAFELTAFDAKALEVASAEEEPQGVLYLLLEAQGDATFDFFIYKGEWYGLRSDSPISVIDPDHNEWYVSAEGTFPATAEVSVRVRPDLRFDIAFETVSPL